MMIKNSWKWTEMGGWENPISTKQGAESMVKKGFNRVSFGVRDHSPEALI
jgi:hypothetical protein